MNKYCLFLFVFFFFTTIYGQGSNENISELDTIIPWQEQLRKLNKEIADLYDKGQFTPAKQLAEKAVFLAQKQLGTNSVSYATALYNLTIFLELEGNNELAIDTYLEIKTIEEQLNVGYDNLSISYNAIGCSYAMIGDYHNALNYFDQAVELRQKEQSPNDSILITFLSDKALCLQNLGQLQTTYETNQECLRLIQQLEEPNTTYIQQVALYCYQNLAAISIMNDNESKKVVAYLEQAQKIIKEYQPPQKSYYTYELLGDLKIAQKEYAQAHFYYDKALPILKKELVDIQKDIRLGQLLTQKAIAYRANNQLKEALEYHEKALASITVDTDDNKNSLSPFINKLSAINLLAEKAKTLAEKKELKTAYQTYQMATQLIPETRRSYKEEGSKYQLAKNTTALYENAIEVAIALYQETDNELYLQEALNLSESTKAIRLLEDMQDRRFKDSTSILPAELLIKEQAARYQINSLERQIYSIKKQGEVEKEQVLILQDSLLTCKEIYNSQLVKELKQYPKYWALRYDTPKLNLKQIRSDLLSENTAVLEFFIGEKNLYLFVISPTDFFVKTIPRTPKFQDAFNTLHQIISTSPRSLTTTLSTQYQEFAKVSSYVYQTLLEPALQFNNNAIEQLIIIPDGLLFNIPLGVLLTKPSTTTNYSISNNDYLFEDYALSYHYAINLFKDSPSSTTEKVFAGFAPTFQSYPYLNPLAYADDEVQSSSSIFEGQAFLDKEAHYNAFKNEAETAKILHLATHAEKDMEYEKLNKIYLTDTILTHYDLEKFNFNTDLVVLSACNTGSGKLIKGEGAMTLARSILQAGCPSVVAASWSVDDNTSKFIILDFYKRIYAGLSKDKALQLAKKKYLENVVDNDLSAHPFYWASFQQYGRSTAIFSPPKYLSCGGLFLLVLGLFALFLKILFKPSCK